MITLNHYRAAAPHAGLPFAVHSAFRVPRSALRLAPAFAFT